MTTHDLRYAESARRGKARILALEHVDNFLAHVQGNVGNARA